jgi:hypothetical protein
MVPKKPHPNCLCFVTPEVMGLDEFEKLLVIGQFQDWVVENG